MKTAKIRVKYEEWLMIEDVDSDDEALKIAYDITVDNYGQEFADFSIFEMESEVGA